MSGTTDTEGRILDAAVQLFAQQGFSGTTTREIARLADVNETSLFRYFPRKLELFWAAVESQMKRLRVRKELQRGLSEGEDPEQVLPLVAELLVHTALYQPELIRLLYVGFLELRPGAEEVYRQHFAPIIASICDYIRSCGESGVLRPVDPYIAAIAFTTGVLAHQGFYPLLGGAHTPYANTEEAVLAYSSFWLEALRPRKVISNQLSVISQ